MKNAKSYPGAHIDSTNQAGHGNKPRLERAKAQLLIMWGALSQYIEDKLREGKNVNIKGFGAFAFNIQTDLPRIAQRSINPLAKIGAERTARKHIHHIAPKFVPDNRLAKNLIHWLGKDEIDAPKSQSSVYQKGFHMIFCNPYPIAAASQLPTAVVKDGLEAFFHAVIDLMNFGKDIDLNFGFARIHIIDRNLKAGFKKNFKVEVEDKEFEEKMKMSNTSCSSFWKTSYKKEWQKSTLGNLI